MTNEWWRGAIIYHIYLRSFADSDGDGRSVVAAVVLSSRSCRTFEILSAAYTIIASSPAPEA